MKYALIIFTFVISVCSAQFGNNQSMSKTGTTVAQFLKIGTDPVFYIKLKDVLHLV